MTTWHWIVPIFEIDRNEHKTLHLLPFSLQVSKWARPKQHAYHMDHTTWESTYKTDYAHLTFKGENKLIYERKWGIFFFRMEKHTSASACHCCWTIHGSYMRKIWALLMASLSNLSEFTAGEAYTKRHWNVNAKSDRPSLSLHANCKSLFHLRQEDKLRQDALRSYVCICPPPV